MSRNRFARTPGRLLLCLTLAFAAVLAAAPWAVTGPREDAWKEVQEAMSKGLPKTAIEKLDPIIAQAKKDKDWDTAIRATGMKIALEGNIQGNQPEERIVRMQEAIKEAPDEMKPVMHAILAHWYWHYFQRNRWRIMQRTQTTQPPSDDVTTWSLPRISQEIRSQFDEALKSREMLKKTPVGDYADLLTKGTMPDSYRPTMFDFVVHEALTYYSSGEQNLVQSEDVFELTASSPIFSGTDQFLAWDLQDAGSGWKVEAIKLYQELLRFHADDEDRTAYLAADLDRLIFGKNHASGEEKDARYIAALKRFAQAHRDHELASRAYFEWASVLQQQSKLVEARKIALQGKNLHPQSVGGKQCHNLIETIEAKSYTVITERVWNEAGPQIDVRYRNLTKLHFRLVKADWTSQLQQSKRRPERLDVNERKKILARNPQKSWSVDLPATPDYQQRVESLDAPDDVPRGFYYLIASHDEDFDASDNQVFYTDLWVSDLALIVRQQHGIAKLGGQVTDAITGNPIAGADVHIWLFDRRNWKRQESVKTDKAGLFEANTKHQNSHVIEVVHRDDQLVSANQYYTYRYNNQPVPDERTIFFTDRALYRPGQTISFKGISIRVDQQKDNYSVLKNRELTVIFSDANGEEIARQKQRTNDYGSFSGSFTAPRDRLMGAMSIRVDGEPNGATQVRVEEYKRPKFQVEVKPPADAASLGESVTLTGKATAYTGAPIDGAKVRWRVVRQVRFPPWWYWYRGWHRPQGNSQEIAHGTATTDADGTFTFEFVAKPDPDVDPDSEPVFTFAITADVTDSAGETRSGDRSLSVGYTALQATMAADEWQTEADPVKLTINTTSLDGESRPAEGTVKIHRLDPPAKVHRADLAPNYWRGQRRGNDDKPEPDLSNPQNWPLGEVVAEKNFETPDSGTTELEFELKAGAYQAVLETQDRFGKPVSARTVIRVLDPDAKNLALKVPFLMAAPTWKLEPGDTFKMVWGSGYDQARAYIELEHRGKLLQAFWTDARRTQLQVTQEITEAMRGGFTVRATMIRENRAYTQSHHVNVPWTNKQLTLKWERFTSKLKPGQEETWTAIVKGPDAKNAVAELVAGLYDASLDAFLPHQWMQAFNVFRTDHSRLSLRFENQMKSFNHLHGQWRRDHRSVQISWRSFPGDIVGYLFGYQWFGNDKLKNRRRPGAPAAGFAAPAAEMSMQNSNRDGLASLARKSDAQGEANDRSEKQAGRQGAADGRSGPDLDQVSARKNLSETAFFFPHLVSTDEGEVRIEFQMPEALTEWKFLGFAHDGKLRSGSLSGTTVTAKDLMVQPNPPRFVREGDVLEFSVKVTNQSSVQQTGTVRLSFADARTNDSVNDALGITQTDQSFDVPAGQSKSYSWKMTVPDKLGFLTYKVVGASERLSDGEEGYLPVLPRRVLITESLPLPIRGGQTKKFKFDHLLNAGESDSLEHQSLTVQMTSNPSWYAVMALPYLMEYPYQCSEQVFNRLYANALARHIANSDPKIHRIFEQWRGTPALDSPLLKNEELKSLMIEETPWLRQANQESQARRNIGILFDDNRLNQELSRALRQLSEQQLGDGAWPWFPGGRANDYITLYITTGFGRLRHLGVDVDVQPAKKALGRLDGWIDRIYREILKRGNKDKNHLNPTIALYLYGRSFFLQDQAIGAKHKEAVDYFLGQAKKYWLQVANRQSQAHLAIALQRFGDKETPQDILNSLRERSVTDEELGMFWRELEFHWWWYRAPIETQAMMIEVFEEVGNDAEAVEECKVWLLKQKQTQDWKTTKATADAVYALLLRGGTNVLASDALVEVTLGETTIEPANVEAGTGFYQEKFTRGEIKPEFGNVTVKKTDPGVAWGSVHWQYFEDISKVPSYDGTPLKLAKTLWTKVHTKDGPVLKPVEGALNVGDELVVRVEMRVDRDMEYVHLKDQRGSGTEPVDVLSKYKYRDGLAYYQSTRDTASHFFIDYLPKGTYVFEYSTYVVHRGEYQSGVASIQCMYAPEFNAHSNSVLLNVE